MDEKLVAKLIVTTLLKVQNVTNTYGMDLCFIIGVSHVILDPKDLKLGSNYS